MKFVYDVWVEGDVDYCVGGGCVGDVECCVVVVDVRVVGDYWLYLFF